MDHVSNRFEQRGYKKDLLQKSRERINEINRIELIKEKTTGEIDKGEAQCTFIITYTPGIQELQKILTKHWNMLS